MNNSRKSEHLNYLGCAPNFRATIFPVLIIDAVNLLELDSAIQPAKLVVHVVQWNHLSSFDHLNYGNQLR